jgi:hypothetical protein
MYREPPPAAEIEAARRDLVYVPRDAEYGIGSFPGFGAMLLGFAGIIAGAIVAMRSPNLGGLVMLVSILAAIGLWLWLRRGHGIVFSVVRGELVVRRRAFVRSRIALSRLEDVIVDGDLHHACITLVPEEPQRRIELTKKNIARGDCVEWAAKIRAHLREHGWTPLEERPPISSAG